MVYLTGDMHGNFEDPRFKFFNGLSEEDIVIVLGDFGFDWSAYHIKNYEVPCRTLFLAGNHENYDILNGLPRMEMYGAEVGILKDNVYHLLNGNIYDVEGMKLFIFGGGYSIDKCYRIPHISWWEDEIPSTEDFNNGIINLTSSDFKIDYMLTHTCSDREAERLFCYGNTIHDEAGDMIEKYKNMIGEHGSMKHHFFGHHHRHTSEAFMTCLFTEIYNLSTGRYVDY